MESENHGMVWVGKDIKAYPVPFLPRQEHLPLSQDNPSSIQREMAQPGWKRSPRQGGLGGSGESKELHWIPNRKNILHWDRGRFPSFQQPESLNWSGHIEGDTGTTVAPEQPEVELLRKERQDLGTQLVQHYLKPLISPGSCWKVLKCFETEYLDFKKNKVPIGKGWI